MINGKRLGKKFWFSLTVPDEVFDACSAELLRNEYIIPSWCEEVRVYWDATGENSFDGGITAAYIESNYAYRFASLSICPPFLNEEQEDRDQRIKHELCHIITAPLIQYTYDLLGILTEDDTIKQLTTKEMNGRIEAVTEDLANALKRRDNE